MAVPEARPGGGGAKEARPGEGVCPRPNHQEGMRVNACMRCIYNMEAMMREGGQHGAPSYLVRGSYALNGTTYFPEMYPGILHGNQAGKLLVAY